MFPRWGGSTAWTTHKPRAYQRRQIAKRTPVPLLEPANDPKGKLIAYRIGVDEWIVYLMTEGQDETLEAYGAEIIPAVNSNSLP